MRPAFALLLLSAACASPLASLRHEQRIEATPGTVVLRWTDADTLEVPRVTRSVSRAAERLSRWGGLKRPVTVHVVPSHGVLSSVVGRSYPWLRAWALDDTVVLQSPRSWPGVVRDVEVDELVVHELTHCVLFQNAGVGDAWKTKRIPFWFREGMATVSANQGPLFPSLEDLARWQAKHPEADVFTDGDALSVDDFDHVYGQAHHALTFLQSRYGNDVVNRIMAGLPTAPDFDAAFVTQVGLTVESFAREFRTYLKLRGFRGWGRPLHPSPPAPERRF